MTHFKATPIIIIAIISLLLSQLCLSNPVLASNVIGSIDGTNRYAWGENIGWVDFGTANGGVTITDTSLSGYALSETAGWIYLGNIVNNGNGVLSGYAWSENTGWID